MGRKIINLHCFADGCFIGAFPQDPEIIQELYNAGIRFFRSCNGMTRGVSEKIEELDGAETDEWDIDMLTDLSYSRPKYGSEFSSENIDTGVGILQKLKDAVGNFQAVMGFCAVFVARDVDKLVEVEALEVGKQVHFLGLGHLLGGDIWHDNHILS